MFQGLSGAILEALILMLGAAILGGIIVWLLMRSRRSAGQISTEQWNELNEKFNAQAKQLADCGAQRSSLETQLKAAIAEQKRLQAELDLLAAPAVQTGPARGAETEPKTEAPAAETPGGKESEAEILKRIKQNATKIDFGRIGAATGDERDDLLIIKGIGPFIEKRLHSIGIYTFRQIANFTPEDEEQVNEVIEFFPGRIRREKWVEQAAELDRKKRDTGV